MAAFLPLRSFTEQVKETNMLPYIRGNMLNTTDEFINIKYIWCGCITAFATKT